tara:strand:+ start:240 stop:443 length:204 start_codon:yes stop_codon:yes gene_type:complete
MSDFHLKFTQCHGCKGFDRYEEMIWDSKNRAFCTEECKDEAEIEEAHDNHQDYLMLVAKEERNGIYD